MILCLDVGNTHLFGGVFVDNKIVCRFRLATKSIHTSDEIGVFLRAVLRENNLSYSDVRHIALASVVPSLDYSLRSACIKYFSAEPYFLRADSVRGLSIKTQVPSQVGADLIAGAMAAASSNPNKNIIIVDMGTATTFVAVNKNAELLGVSIMPGCRAAVNSLASNASALSVVEMIKPDFALGRETAQSVQAGVYHMQLGAVKHITQLIASENFSGQECMVIGTGGLTQLFLQENIFDEHAPDLVLEGIYLAWQHQEELAAS